MMDKVYLVIREKGTHTDEKTYYESETTILGARDNKEDAAAYLKKVVKHFYPNDNPIRGTYDYENKLDTSYVFRIDDEGLEDNFWIKAMDIGEKGDIIP